MSRARIKAIAQSFHSVLGRSPIQQEASLLCVPCGSSSLHCMWNPQDHMDMVGTRAHAKEPQDSQEPRQQRGPREWDPLSWNSVSPNFHRLAMVLPLLVNDLYLQVWLMGTFPTSPQLPCAWAHLPFVQSLPPVICRGRTGGFLGNVEWQVKVGLNNGGQWQRE